MGAPGLTSPIRGAAFENLQLNAGIFLVDLDYSSIADAAALKTAIATAVTAGTSILGVTRGGGAFNVTKETRTPDVDGMRYPFKGSDFVDSADAYLSTTLLEVSAANFKRLLASGDSTTSGKKTTVTMRTAIDPDTDYIDHLCWVGDISDGRLVLIELDNAINTADFALTFTDKGEGTMAAEFHARQSSVLDYDNAPFRAIFFDVTPNPGVSVSPRTKTLTVGDEFTMGVSANPSNATVTWTSSSTTVATISSAGEIEAKAAGTTTITASITVDGTTKTDTADITVVAAS